MRIFKFWLCLLSILALNQLGHGQNLPRLVLQSGHTGGAESTAISRDGKLALSVGKNVVLWNVESRRQLRSWTPIGADFKAAQFKAAQFLPDEKNVRFVTADAVGNLALWDAATGAMVRQFAPLRGGFEALAIAPDGKTGWAAGWDNEARQPVTSQFDVESGAELRREKLAATALAFSPDGRWLAIGYANDTLAIREAATFEVRAKLDASQIKDGFGGRIKIAFAPDGWSLATTYDFSSAKNVRLWSVPDAKPLGEVAGFGPVAFSKSGRLLSVNHPDGIRVYDVGSMPAKAVRTWEKRTYRDVVTLGEGRFWSVGGGFLLDHQIEESVFWNAAIGKVDVGLRGAPPLFKGPGLKVSPDGDFVALGTALWSVGQGRFVQYFGTRESDYAPALDVLWHNAGNAQANVVTVGSDMWRASKGVNLWRVAPESSENARIARTLGGREPVAISLDGKWIAARNAQDSAPPLILHSATAATPPRTLAEKADVPSALAFAPDAKTLAFAARDICLLDVTSGAITRRLHAPWQSAPDDIMTGWHPDQSGIATAALAFSPDGKTLASVQAPSLIFARSQLCLWNAQTGELLWSHDLKDWGESLAFSADGTRLVCGGFGAIHEFDVQNGEARGDFVGHQSAVRGVQFAGKWLWSASEDGTYRLWDAQTRVQKAQLIFVGANKWIVTDEGGHFDSNAPDDLDALGWVLPSQPFEVLPVETFFRQSFEPRLLSRILEGETLPALDPNRFPQITLPRVQILEVKANNARDVAAITVAIVGAPNQRIESIQLKRDGVLCATFSPENGLITDENGRARHTFESVAYVVNGVLDAGGAVDNKAHSNDIEFIAYAFESGGARSVPAHRKWEPPLPPNYDGKYYQAPQGRAIVVTIGVNQYENPRWNLAFAAPDARVTGDELEKSLASVYSKVTRLSLVSDGTAGAILPTKANIRAVLEALSGHAPPVELAAQIPALEDFVARPNDTVIISFSGHGIGNSSGQFFLLPQDIGAQSNAVSPALLERCVSSDDLADWLRGADAASMALVLDCCHSAGAVQTPDFKPAPGNSKGLAQLAYDKGIAVLAASGADDVALESGKLKHGLLTYALVIEGLEARKAVVASETTDAFSTPTISLRDWLSYARGRVGPLSSEVRRGDVQALPGRGKPILERTGNSNPEDDAAQRPFLFDFRDEASAPIWEKVITLGEPLE